MYKQEFKLHWQLLMVASVGLGLGSALSHYTMSLFGPPLIAEFLASPMTQIIVLSLAVAIVGLAQGAEGDIGAYLISRRFDLKNFSLLLSFLTASIALARRWDQ